MATLDFVAAGTFRANASLLRPLALARELTALGHDSLCHLLDSPCTRELAADVEATRLVRWVPTKNPREYLKSIRPPSQKPILILGNVSLVGICCAFRNRRRGGIVVSDWDEWLSTKSHYPLSRRLIWRSLERAARRWSHGFVFASADLKAAFADRYPKIPSTYISYGMTCAQLVSPLAEFPAWQPPLGSRWLAYLGSLTTAYTRDLQELKLLVAVAAAAGLKVLVIGDGEQRPSLEADLKSGRLSGQVVFCGYMKPGSVDALLARSEIAACFLPLEDTLHNRARCPNKLYHYMRAQKSVITNRVGEVARTLLEAGYYYRYSDYDSLSQAVRQASTTAVRYDLSSVSWTRRAEAFDQWLGQYA